MCQEEDELEAFVDAIPGYLQMDGNAGAYNNRGVGGRLHDINFLRKVVAASPSTCAPLHFLRE